MTLSIKNLWDACSNEDSAPKTLKIESLKYNIASDQGTLNKERRKFSHQMKIERLLDPALDSGAEITKKVKTPGYNFTFERKDGESNKGWKTRTTDIMSDFSNIRGVSNVQIGNGGRAILNLEQDTAIDLEVDKAPAKDFQELLDGDSGEIIFAQATKLHDLKSSLFKNNFSLNNLSNPLPRQSSHDDQEHKQFLPFEPFDIG